MVKCLCDEVRCVDGGSWQRQAGEGWVGGMGAVVPREGLASMDAEAVTKSPACSMGGVCAWCTAPASLLRVPLKLKLVLVIAIAQYWVGCGFLKSSLFLPRWIHRSLNTVNEGWFHGAGADSCPAEIYIAGDGRHASVLT